MRRQIIGVMGGHGNEHADLAKLLGGWLAERGYDLLTGGGGGVMAAVSEGFSKVAGRRGVCIGVLPGDAKTGEAFSGYPNEWVEVVIQTHLPMSKTDGAHEDSRNHINVLSADVVVALPGGKGTRTEVRLALRYNRRVVVHKWEEKAIEELKKEMQTEDQPERRPEVATTLEEAQDFITRYAPPRVREGSA